MTPASGSPSSVPPLRVAAASACHGCSPAVTRHSISHASWFARSEPPPKSVPAAMRTPAAARQPYAHVRPLPPCGDPRLAVGFGEPWICRRRRERAPGLQDGECRDHSDAVRGHGSRDVGVELETVLKGVDSGLRADLRAGELAGVRGDPSAALVRGVDHGPHLADGKRGGVRVRSVEVQLHEVGAVVELPDRGAYAGRRRRPPRCRAHGAGRRIGRPTTRPRVRRGTRGGRPIDRVRQGPAHGSDRRPDRSSSEIRRRGPSARRPLAEAGHCARRPASNRSAGSKPRSIQCAPPGNVRWLWLSTSPGTMVQPDASTTSVSAPGSGSSSVGRIHAMRSSSTSKLTPTFSCGPVPSASAASR